MQARHGHVGVAEVWQKTEICPSAAVTAPKTIGVAVLAHARFTAKRTSKLSVQSMTTFGWYCSISFCAVSSSTCARIGVFRDKQRSGDEIATSALELDTSDSV